MSLSDRLSGLQAKLFVETPLPDLACQLAWKFWFGSKPSPWLGWCPLGSWLCLLLGLLCYACRGPQKEAQAQIHPPLPAAPGVVGQPGGARPERLAPERGCCSKLLHLQDEAQLPGRGARAPGSVPAPSCQL